MNRLLLCTDLDRTLIPNGNQPESSGVRELFSRFVNADDIALVYVSGRHLSLIEQAIDDYQLPWPDFIIADVGSTIYHGEGQGRWRRCLPWDDDIEGDWHGLTTSDVHSLLADIGELERQEVEKQGLHKLSYYVSLVYDYQNLLSDIEARLKCKDIRANLIWSVDKQRQIGLLDILPSRANKRHAITFLMKREGYDIKQTVFAGDSGNDLDVLLSPIPSILVANADDQVRAAVKNASPDTLYVASGDFLNMNGCYGAGILEGIAHYHPHFVSVLEGLQ
jgi:hypothetical protein